MTRTEHLESAAAFPPHVLREYALLADGQRGILIGPRGDISWSARLDGTPLPCSRVSSAGAACMR